MLENNTKKHNALTIQQLFIGCETHRGRYKGLKPDGKTNDFGRESDSAIGG